MKTKDEIQEEIQIAEIGRDAFRAIRCARKTDNLRLAKLAADEEDIYQRRIEELTEALAKAPKRAA